MLKTYYKPLDAAPWANGSSNLKYPIMDLYELRNEYMSERLDEADVLQHPIDQFAKWFAEAQQSKIYEPNAMTVATAAANGLPSARILLLKAFDQRGFVFFSNYGSRKAIEMDENPHAALVFFWAELERQVRVTGMVSKVGEAESDAYFTTRPVGSRLGAWASPQSAEIADRTWLEAQHTHFREKYKKGEIPRPQHWGGYLLVPQSVEFWQGRSNRLHDRLEYNFVDQAWKIRRLAP